MDDELPRGRFWSRERALLSVLFILGLVIGGLVTNKYIDPYLNSAQAADRNSLLAQNQSLDARSDQLYSCLVGNGIEPGSCGVQGAQAVENRPVATSPGRDLGDSNSPRRDFST